MKYCDDYAALLDLYVDGELSPGEMARVQAHLDVCPDCRAYVDDALAIRAAFPDVEDTPVPGGFAEGVMSAIQASPQPEAVPKKERRHWMRVLLPLAACCAIVVLLRNGIPSMGAKTESAMDTSAAMTTADSAAADDADNSAVFYGAAETAEESETGDIATAAMDRQAPRLDPGETSPAASNDDLSVKMETTDDSSGSSAPTGASGNPHAPLETAKSETDAVNSETTYFTTLILPPEAADLLAEYTPFEEDEIYASYALPGEAYEELLTQLFSFDFTEQLHPEVYSDSDTFLVLLRHS